ncbi:MAG: thioredoxin family protein [Candidatus Aenigmatarchaeota archaeon]
MKEKFMIAGIIIGLVVFVAILISISKPLVPRNYTQEIGYSDKIEEAIINCTNCNICPDGKIISPGKICVYFFWGQGCPHCAEEKPFLEELKKKYPNLEIYDFEVYYHPENVELWEQVCEKCNTQPSGVPMTFIGDKVFIGFANRGFYNSSSIPTSHSILPSTTVLAIIFACVLSIVIIFLLLMRKLKIKVKT